MKRFACLLGMPKKILKNISKDASIAHLRTSGALHVDIKDQRDGVYVYTQQCHINNVFSVLCSHPLRVDVLLDIFSVCENTEEQRLYYVFFASFPGVRYVVTFIWNKEPVPSLHKRFGNASALQKEVLEKNRVTFLDACERAILHVGDAWRPKGGDSFSQVFWPTVYRPDLFVVCGEKNRDVVRSAYIQSGILHRNIETKLEKATPYQALLYMNRLDQQAGFLQEYSYVRAMELLMGIEAPERAQWIRLILSEVVRQMAYARTLCSVAVAANFFTVFAKFDQLAQFFQDIMRAMRAPMAAYVLFPGGVRKDLDDDLAEALIRWSKQANAFCSFVRRWCLGQKTFKGRTEGLGVLGSREALAMGCTGPVLRASGGLLDVRVRQPYDAYALVTLRQYSASSGCAYARCTVLLDEMEESSKLINEGLKRMNAAPKDILHPHALLYTDKNALWTRSLDLMRHSHVYAKGVRCSGRVYGCVEGPGGEKGTSLVMFQGKTLRVKVRPSTLPCLLAFSFMSKDLPQEDLAVLVASLGIIPTEIDR